MRLRTMGYLTSEAVGSVRDNGLLSVAAVSTVAISLLVLALIGLLALNLQHLASVVDDQVQIVAYLGTATPVPPSTTTATASSTTSAAGGDPASSTTSAASTQPASSSSASAAAASASAASGAALPEDLLLQQIRALPDVNRAVLVSKAQALQQIQQELGQNADLTAEFEQNNPLPDSVDIYVDDPRAVSGVAAAVAGMDGVKNISNAQGIVDKLVAFTQAVRVLGIFLVAALALATIVVIGNTVRVAVWARRDQIGIMKLVGATDGFIRWPFFIEGAILGLGGAAVSAALVGWGYVWVVGVVNQNLPFLPLLPPQELLPWLLEALLFGGVLLGALGSAVSVRRHLDV